MPAIIRITLNDVTDEEAVQIKRAVEKIVETRPDSQVELTITPPR